MCGRQRHRTNRRGEDTGRRKQRVNKLPLTTLTLNVENVYLSGKCHWDREVEKKMRYMGRREKKRCQPEWDVCDTECLRNISLRAAKIISESFHPASTVLFRRCYILLFLKPLLQVYEGEKINCLNCVWIPLFDSLFLHKTDLITEIKNKWLNGNTLQ